MAGLVPAIHAAPMLHMFQAFEARRDVDDRVKPGHDGINFKAVVSYQILNGTAAFPSAANRIMRSPVPHGTGVTAKR